MSPARSQSGRRALPTVDQPCEAVLFRSGGEPICRQMGKRKNIVLEGKNPLEKILMALATWLGPGKCRAPPLELHAGVENLASGPSELLQSL